MITTINENDFIQAFKTMGRDGQFSHEALQELFKYYEEYENSTGETVELDVIAICCEWAEYQSQCEMKDDYDPEMIILAGSFLNQMKQQTTVIEFKVHKHSGYTANGEIFKGIAETHYLVLAF